MSLDRPDDVDRLYARLETIAPPADFMQRVAAATYAAPGPVSTRWRLWLLLDAAALVLLAALSVSFGIALHETGALDLVALLVLDSARDELGAIVEALVGTLPWLQLVLLAVNVGAVVL